jgi:NADH-quinone oxidoreductase subunit J
MVIFYILATIIIVSAILAVTSRYMVRSATFLLFVLIATAGLYLLLDYHFLAAVQLSVYAGGILILFIFAILLTNAKGDRSEPADKKKVITGVFTAVCGTLIATVVLVKHVFLYAKPTLDVAGKQEINMKEIGYALMGTGKYQYLLPFEVLSVLLLACIIGGILIARKR